MNNAVMHSELIAQNPAALRRFYVDLFGWDEEDYPEAQYTILRHGDGAGIDLAIGAAMPGLKAGPTTYVSVDDVDAYVAKLQRIPGVSIIQAPYDIEGMGRFAVFTDPEGNRIGLWQLPRA
ncbi:VOC family protein [Devosia soli]|nr:VOC family protein [Devosia soli]